MATVTNVVGTTELELRAGPGRVVVGLPGLVDNVVEVLVGLAVVVGAVNVPVVNVPVVNVLEVVVLVVVVLVVVVLVVVVDDGSGDPAIRGTPISSKCMPSGILHVPPQAKPLRRNT